MHPSRPVKKMKDRIYQVMKSLGKTQKEFAGELCIAEGTLSSVFSGRTKPSANIVAAIHECYPNISVTWLMFGEGEMYVASSQNQPNLSDHSTEAVAPTFQQMPNNTPVIGNVTPSFIQLSNDKVKNSDKPQRKITEIRIFFDDGTFEIFEPKH